MARLLLGAQRTRQPDGGGPVPQSGTERSPEETREGAAPSPLSKPLLALSAVLGFVAGGWFGGPLATPLVARIAAGGGGDHGGEVRESGGHGTSPVQTDAPLVVADLVVNPARSGGTRFLVAAASLVGDRDALASLSAREAEMRDLLLTLLASRTVEELTEVSARDGIREELKAALNELLGYAGVHRIFFTQFVIQ